MLSYVLSFRLGVNEISDGLRGHFLHFGLFDLSERVAGRRDAILQKRWLIFVLDVLNVFFVKDTVWHIKLDDMRLGAVNTSQFIVGIEKVWLE